MNLPIDPLLPAIAEAVRAGHLVLEAPPGAGKTTRVPPALLSVVDGLVIVAQPRRLAARMAAARVAAELGERVGDTAGYEVRFDRRIGPRTRIAFVTEGILLRRLIDDGLDGVGAVVLDEFHERNLDADLALALCARRARRVVVMSATLDAEPVAAYLGAARLRAEGRTYPIAIEHAQHADDRPLERRVAAAARTLLGGGLDGDVLVFLPGAREIRRCAEACAGLDADVVPLHGELSAEAQDRAVMPSSRRKLILSTNVAETSLTIEGVVAVIDSGLARVAAHSPWSGLPTLRTAPISQASATQRAGRAGRTRPGRCIRLYTEHDLRGRPAHTAPEIARADLAGALLALRAGGVTDPRAFPWLEAPPAAAVEAAETLLGRLGAIDAAGGLTELGRRMLRFPAHPRLARLIVEGEQRGVASDAALAAAVLGERDLRRRDRLDGARDAAHTSDSDVVDAMDLVRANDRTLDRRTVDAVRRAHRQLRPPPQPSPLRGEGAASPSPLEGERAGVRGSPHDSHTADAAVRIALLAAFPDRVARRRRPGGRELVMCGGGQVDQDPASAVRDAELVIVPRATNRAATMVSAIELDWLLDVAPDALRDESAVEWNAGAARVERVDRLRYEQLALTETRRPPGPDDAEAAAAVLARAALDAGIDRFVDAGALAALRGRIAFAAAHDPRVQPLDDDALAARLAEACYGRASFAELAGADLLAAVRAGVPVAVTELAPERVELRSGRKPVVHYEPDKPPWIESRLQDFFGMTETPRVARGRVPVVVHLLAPNQRAVQVTDDLGGFWTRHYPDLRKQLARRYPRHAWPDDPTVPQPGMRPRKSR